MTNLRAGASNDWSRRRSASTQMGETTAAKAKVDVKTVVYKRDIEREFTEFHDAYVRTRILSTTRSLDQYVY
jgi:hypothetical protein